MHATHACGSDEPERYRVDLLDSISSLTITCLIYSLRPGPFGQMMKVCVLLEQERHVRLGDKGRSDKGIGVQLVSSDGIHG